MKLKVKWSPDLRQDLDALTTKGSFVYDEKLTTQIIDEYGSIAEFKESDRFKQMKQDFDAKH